MPAIAMAVATQTSILELEAQTCRTKLACKTRPCGAGSPNQATITLPASLAKTRTSLLAVSHVLGHLVGLTLYLGDVAHHVEGHLWQVIVLAVQNALEA